MGVNACYMRHDFSSVWPLVRLLLNIYGTNTHATRDDMLGCSLSILHTGDLSGGMTSSLAHSLDGGYDLLILSIFAI